MRSPLLLIFEAKLLKIIYAMHGSAKISFACTRTEIHYIFTHIYVHTQVLEPVASYIAIII